MAARGAGDSLRLMEDCRTVRRALLFSIALNYELSFAFTISLNIRPSAFLPAKAACTVFITLPMSFIELAPVSDDCCRHCRFNFLARSRLRQIRFDYFNLRFFLVRQILTSAFFILFN